MFFFFTFLNTVLETNLEIVLETAFKLDSFQKKKFFFLTIFITVLVTYLEIGNETALKLVIFSKKKTKKYLHFFLCFWTVKNSDFKKQIKFFFYGFEHCLETNLEIVLETPFKLVI